MRDITVSVDDETYRRARIAAAETDTERRKRQEREVRSQIQENGSS